MRFYQEKLLKKIQILCVKNYTALLENSPGELIIDKEKVMLEASERAIKTKALFDKKDLEK